MAFLRTRKKQRGKNAKYVSVLIRMEKSIKDNTEKAKLEKAEMEKLQVQLNYDSNSFEENELIREHVRDHIHNIAYFQFNLERTSNDIKTMLSFRSPAELKKIQRWKTR
jgi:hypothetical protein